MTMNPILSKFISWVAAAFEATEKGASAKKFILFGCAILTFCLEAKFANPDNIVEIVIINLSFMLVLLGLTAWGYVQTKKIEAPGYQKTEATTTTTTETTGPPKKSTESQTTATKEIISEAP